MSKYVDGEVIYLVWENQVDELFVKGHMAPEEAHRLLESYYGDQYQFSDPAPCYGRWSQEAGPDDITTVLRTYSERGKGRFPIMAATVIPPYAMEALDKTILVNRQCSSCGMFTGMHRTCNPWYGQVLTCLTCGSNTINGVVGTFVVENDWYPNVALINRVSRAISMFNRDRGIGY